jgi:hypothetical protein
MGLKERTWEGSMGGHRVENEGWEFGRLRSTCTRSIWLSTQMYVSIRCAATWQSCFFMAVSVPRDTYMSPAL